MLNSLGQRLAHATGARPDNFPPGPKEDVALDLASDPLAFLTRMKAEYGGIVGLSLAGERVVLISDP